MAATNTNILNLPVTLGLTGAEWVPIVVLGNPNTTTRVPTAAFNLAGVVGGATPQNANVVLAGPASGSPATVTFRSLVLADIPQGATSGIPLIAQGTGFAPVYGGAIVAGGGTGRITLTNHSVLVGAGTAAITQIAVPASGTLFQGNAAADPTWSATPTLGVQQTTQGSLTLANTAAGAFGVTLQSSNTATAGWSLTFPKTAGTNGFVLTTDGTGVTNWTVAATGTVSSINVSGGTTGLTTSGGPVTTTGTITLAGTLVVANGGTGQTTLTAHAVLIGEGTSAITQVAPGATGIPLVSQGASADPAFATAGVAGGGTGQVTLTNHGVLVGAGTAAITQLAAAAAGTLLAGQGASVDPSFSATPTLGVAGTTMGTLSVAGSGSGTITIQPQAAAGTYNFNLPTSAGASGAPLLSGGGGATAMSFASSLLVSSATINQVSGGVWNDTTSLLGVQGVTNPANAYFNPLYFGNAATGLVHRFNRVKVGIAALSSSDVPQTTPDWLDSLAGLGAPTTGGFSSGNQLTVISAIGETGIAGAARSSDFPTWDGLGNHTGGAEGVIGWGLNDDFTGGSPIAVGVNPIGIRAANKTSTVTITIASPGVVTWTSHGLIVGDAIYFTTTGSLPTGITANYPNLYFVISAGFTANSFQFSTAIGGAAVNTSGSQSGTQTATASINGITLGAQSDVNNGGEVITLTPSGGVIARSTISHLFTPGAYNNLGFINPSAALVVGGGGSKSANVTITIASPGVITWTAHNLSIGASVTFATTGSLPTGITAGVSYFIVVVGSANTFQISATRGGAAINTSGTQSGTHTGTFAFPQFNKGAIWLAGGLDTSQGGGGQGVAIEMARSQSIRWLNSGNTTDAELWGASGGLVMGTPFAGAENLTVQPAGNTLNTLSSVVSQVNDTAGGTGLEYGAVFTITTTHNTGSIAPNKVGLYSAAVNNSATGGSIWGGNTVCQVGASSPSSGFASQCWEFDTNNQSSTARTYSNLGSPIYGISITGVSNQTCTSAILISGNPGSPQWTSGMVFNNFRSGNNANFGIDFGFDVNTTVAKGLIGLPNNSTITFSGGNISQSTVNGTTPTIGALSGLGTGTASVAGGPNAGTITLSPTGSPSSTGSFTLGWIAWPTTGANIVFQAFNGSGTWTATPSFLVTFQSTTQVSVTWTNGGAAALTAGSTYKIMYVAIGT